MELLTVFEGGLVNEETVMTLMVREARPGHVNPAFLQPHVIGPIKVLAIASMPLSHGHIISESRHFLPLLTRVHLF